jgi:hypothetical protein
MNSITDLFDWVVTITGITVLLMFFLRAAQKEETPLVRLLASINAIAIKVGAVSALLFLLILHYQGTQGVLTIKSIGFYVAVGSILLTILQGWGVKATLIESVGTVVANKAKEMQGRITKMAEDARRDGAKKAQPTDQWYYVHGKERKGPFSEGQFKELAASGELTASTMVWKKSLASWTPASEIEGLFAPAGDAPPPAPTEETVSPKVPA